MLHAYILKFIFKCTTTPLHMPKHLEEHPMKTIRNVKSMQCEVMFNKTFIEKKEGKRGTVLQHSYEEVWLKR